MMTKEQSECMRDALYFAWLLIHAHKAVSPQTLKLDEKMIMSCLRDLTGGTDEISKEYFETGFVNTSRFTNETKTN